MLWTEGFSVMKRAAVNRIIPFSNVDGPGNRTSIFFQGCTFHCRFCHNPETMECCRHCGKCVPGCPAGALSVSETGTVLWDSEKCVRCDACIRICPHFASPRVRWMTVPEVMEKLRRSMPYIDGITVSGGDCTLYPEFLTDLFSEVRREGKTCLIDANGAYDFSGDPALLNVCDGVMLDVKAVDAAWSAWLIGRSPDMVLKNLDYLLSVKKLAEVRTVILPSRDQENEQTVRYVAEKIGNHCPYKIIRYRPFGVKEDYQKQLGEVETEEAYAERFAALARSLGASGAYVV